MRKLRRSMARSTSKPSIPGISRSRMTQSTASRSSVSRASRPAAITTGAAGGPDGHGPPRRREAVEGVADQVFQDSAQHQGIRADGGERVRQLALERTAARVGDAADRLADRRVDVARLAGRLRGEAGVIRREVLEIWD